jgi:(p)ppGpp synthase/HD superfamily hydrolase
MNKNKCSSEIIAYAIKCHSETNHLYDGKPYALHLAMVVDTALTHLDTIPDVVHGEVIAACWLHDVIEDCRQTYNDVKSIAGAMVADIVYAVSNEKGKTRKERANAKYYEGIKATSWATFVKLCDRIANVRYSKETGSKMFEMYRKENDEFLAFLNPSIHYLPLVKELNELLNIEQAAQGSDTTKA